MASTTVHLTVHVDTLTGAGLFALTATAALAAKTAQNLPTVAGAMPLVSVLTATVLALLTDTALLVLGTGTLVNAPLPVPLLLLAATVCSSTTAAPAMLIPTADTATPLASVCLEMKQVLLEDTNASTTAGLATRSSVLIVTDTPPAVLALRLVIVVGATPVVATATAPRENAKVPLDTTALPTAGPGPVPLA